MLDIESAPSQTCQKFFANTQPEPRRVFHGRGQRYPGYEHLCIDWYPPVLLLSLYKETSDLDKFVESVLSSDQHQQIEAVIVQKRYEAGAPAECVHGDCAEQITVVENGLKFEVHPGRRQNAGLFMDMRLVRQWLVEHSAQRNVLNLFAYTCSLSVAALAGGARSVTSVDISKTSMLWGMRNHELNHQSRDLIKPIPHNLFTSWGRIKQFGRYDLVIIDPPTRQRGSFDAEKNYAAVVKRLRSLCNSGADVIACLNSPFLDTQWLLDLFAQQSPQAQFEERLPIAPEYQDHDPERGLKICRFTMTAATPDE